MIESWILAQRQSLPLDAKISFAQLRIRQWHSHWRGQVVVFFSGGKDSTVLLHLVRDLYPNVPAVFVNTGLEYPEIVDFVKTVPNVEWLRPGMTFKRVLDKYGYPVVSKAQACAISRYRNTKDPVQKHRRLHGWPKGKKGMISKKWQFLIDAPFKISDACCDVMKKKPFSKYIREHGRYPINGMMASDSKRRRDHYLKYGCNALSIGEPMSRPLAVWTEADVWEYIRSRGIPYSSIYDMGYDRTGCVFCAFGAHLEKSPNRFQRMKETHPKLWAYCMDKLGLRQVLSYVGVPYGC